jgi:hypothetical protein
VVREHAEWAIGRIEQGARASAPFRDTGQALETG